MNGIQNWREFELDERLKRIDADLEMLIFGVRDYYKDFTDINRKNTLAQIVENLEDMIDSIYIFRELYREGGLYHA